MIVDMRIYTCKPGTVRQHLDIYKEHGLAAQKRHLGEPLCYLTTEIGDVNSFVHMWVYEDLADRTRKRAAMMADPDWQAYVKRSGDAGYLVSQQNRIMNTTDFAPLKR